MKARVRAPIRFCTLGSGSIIARKIDFCSYKLFFFFLRPHLLSKVRALSISEQDAQGHKGLVLTAPDNNCFRESERHGEEPPHVFQLDGCNAF